MLDMKVILASNLIDCVDGSYIDVREVWPEAATRYELAVKLVEMQYIKKALHRFNNNQSKACKWLGISRGTLRTKMKAYGIAFK
jgi:DNA-binding protein Fis